MTRVYYKEAVGAMVVFDVTRPGTFEAVQKWKADLDTNLTTAERALPCMLLANKCDLAAEPLDKEKMDAYVKEQGFLDWFETSAKEDIGIKKAFNTIVGHILANDPDVHEADADTVKLTGAGAKRDGAATNSKSKCC